jgi:hypothetical protein
MRDATPEKIEALTRKHLQRYEAMKVAALAGDRSINAEECDHYLGIWRGIEAHGFKWDELAPFQRVEVLDALDDEAVE